MCRFNGSDKFRQSSRRNRSNNFPSFKMELFVTMSQKMAFVSKYTFTDVAGLLDLPLYKCKTEEVLKVPWCIPYWFAFIIRFKRSTHWPIFEAGFGGITNSWSIKTGHINASSSNAGKNLWKHPWGSSFLENIY